MASEDPKERRARKRGRHKVEERERVAADAADHREASSPAPALLPGLVAPGERLPDDDKPQGPGRPVGARAAAPAEYRRFILATRGDFVGRLAGIANADTLQLAQALGCKPLEAAQLQAKMAQIAAPYVYTPQARPPEQLAPGYWAGMMFFAGGQAPPPAPGAAPIGGPMDALAALAGRPPDMQEIQALRPVEFAESEPAESEPEDKAP